MAEVDDAVVDSLRSKHPSGPTHPLGSALGPAPGLAPSEDDIQTGLHAFKPYSAPGISPARLG